MDFSVKQAMKVVVVLVCAVAVIATSIIMINGDDDKIKNKNDELWNTIKELNGSGGSESGGSDNPTSGPNGEPLVSTTESQVGKYADIDGDGTVDGIIFADLIIGGSGEYGPSGMGTYTIPTISSSKSYYVSQESYTNKLGGTAEVLTPIGSGNDRFYVMTLNDISYSSSVEWMNHYWYKTASDNMADFATTTSQEFGAGRQNTLNMIKKWNNKAYGKQSTKDIWGEIQEQVSNGWFLPSSGELSAFAGQLGITKSNYSSKGLFDSYWSSSQYNTYMAYSIYLGNGYVYINHVSNGIPVRLAATF